MKFFCKITLIIFFIFSIINTVKAENEIDKLELIERYIVNYKKNISLVVAKYEIKDNKDIKDTTDSLNFLLEIISKVKDSNMSEQEKERVVKFLTKNRGCVIYLNVRVQVSKKIIKIFGAFWFAPNYLQLIDNYIIFIYAQSTNFF